MTNIFNLRNNLKQEIHQKHKVVYPKHKEIWYVSIGQNVGFEENGKGNDYKKPVLVIKKIGNMYLCIAMTTKGKENSKYYIKLNFDYFKKDSFIITSQVKTYDQKRFLDKIGKVSITDFLNIKKKLRELLL